MKHTYPFSKIVVNTSFGKLSTNSPDFKDKVLPEIMESFATIVGQKGQERPARISIAGFKLREGIVIGLKATLRRKKMMQFIERVVHIVMPRIRDFHGISLHSVDKMGNLTFGIKEHVVFPEIVLEKARVSFGLEITLVPKGKLPRDKAIELYRSIGVPFERTVTAKKNK